MPSEALPLAISRVLAEVMPRLRESFLSSWTPRYIITVAELKSSQIMIGKMVRRQVLAFLADMAHKLDDTQKRQFKSASLADHAPLAIRAFRDPPPLLATQAVEEVGLVFVRLTRSPGVIDDRTRIALTNCPNCNHELSAVGPLKTGTRPKPGDISMCIECGSLLVLTEGLGVRLLADDEELTLPDENRVMVQRMRKAIARVSAENAQSVDANRRRNKPHAS